MDDRLEPGERKKQTITQGYGQSRCHLGNQEGPFWIICKIVTFGIFL